MSATHSSYHTGLAQPLQLRHVTLRNRIVFGAHTSNMSEDGLPGERHLGYYLERARGGAAMIVVEPMPVHATAVLIAIVTWSLAYEWMFYFSLPALACLSRAKVPVSLAIACTLGLVLVILNKPDVIFPTSFVKGAIAPRLPPRRPGLG